MEMLETRKRPAAILASKRLAVGGSGFLLRFAGCIFLFVHHELRRNLESVLNLGERPSGEENLWGVGMRGRHVICCFWQMAAEQYYDAYSGET